MAREQVLRSLEVLRGGERDFRAGISQWPQLVALYDYWLAKRGDRPLPARRDLDPIEIPRLLANLLLADVVPPDGRIRFRLVGTNLVAHYGDDFTGRYLDELDYGSEKQIVRAEYEETARRGAPRFSEMEYWNFAGRHFRIRRLLLPLSSDQATVDMILGMALLAQWSE